ncbi:hypothetical protein Q604_UNBC00030G0001, partial [human gut metagenome]
MITSLLLSSGTVVATTEAPEDID